MTDVIVAGGGHNGLTCAAYLAQADLDVLVLEARDDVGGCASTVDALGGARVNICNCDHTLVRGSGIVEELGLEAHGLRYLDLDPSHLNLTWDTTVPAWLHFRDADRTLESLSLGHPDAVAGYRRYLTELTPAAALLLDVMRAAPTVRNVGAALGRARGRGAGQLLRLSRMSLAAVLGRYFDTDALISPVATTGPAVWGLPPTAPGTGLGALNYAMRHLVATGRPAGGSGALTDALAAAVRAHGGEIRTGARVARILCAGDAVTGVELDGGERLHAARVVAASDPRTALVDWLREPPGAARRLVARYRGRPTGEGYESKIDAVVDALPRARAVDTAQLDRLGVPDPLHPTWIIAPTVAGIAQAHAAATAGGVGERPLFLNNVPSVLDPSVKPPFGHLLSLEVLFTPYRLRGGWADTAEPRRWLQAYAGLLEAGFLDGVRATRLVGPEDYEREFGLVAGHAPSFAGGPVAALVGRDRELTRYATPVTGLFLTGAGTFPGAGVSGAPGRNAAHAVLSATS